MTIAKPTTLSEVRDLGTLPVWHATKPCAAGLLGVSRGLAYSMVQRGHLPSLSLGARVVVPVPALLAMLGEQV